MGNHFLVWKSPAKYLRQDLGGKDENVKAAQDALLVRAKANGEASVGKYVSTGGSASGESLVIKNYVY